MSETGAMPNCDLLSDRHGDIDLIIEFLEWLESAKKVELCERIPKDAAHILDRIVPLMKRPEKLAFEFVGIDEAELDAERRALLTSLRRGRDDR